LKTTSSKKIGNKNINEIPKTLINNRSNNSNKNTNNRLQKEEEVKNNVKKENISQNKITNYEKKNLQNKKTEKSKATEEKINNEDNNTENSNNSNTSNSSNNNDEPEFVQVSEAEINVPNNIFAEDESNKSYSFAETDKFADSNFSSLEDLDSNTTMSLLEKVKMQIQQLDDDSDSYNYNNFKVAETEAEKLLSNKIILDETANKVADFLE